MFYRTSLKGKEPASEKTYRDHDDRWCVFSWVLVDGSEESEVNQEFAGPLYPRAFVYLCYVGQVKRCVSSFTIITYVNHTKDESV